MSMYLYPISSTLENGTQSFLNRNKKQTLGTHMVHIYTILVYSHFARDFETPGIELSWNYLAEDLVQQSTSLGALALGVFFVTRGGVGGTRYPECVARIASNKCIATRNKGITTKEQEATRLEAIPNRLAFKVRRANCVAWWWPSYPSCFPRTF